MALARLRCAQPPFLKRPQGCCSTCNKSNIQARLVSAARSPAFVTCSEQALVATLMAKRYCWRMTITAEKIAEMLALPEQDRAYLARELIASLDGTADADAETAWNEVIDRRSCEIENGDVKCRSVDEVIRDIRSKLNASR